MKKIGILSDTHGYMDDRILHFLAGCDEIWHAGDWGNFAVAEALMKLAPLRGVYGNIDGQDIRLTFHEDTYFMCEEMKIWIHHIGGTPGRYSPDVRTKMPQIKPDIFICGHSHILKVMRDAKHNLLYINPGAAGKHGFHKVRTLILMEIEGKKVTKMNAVELGPRSELDIEPV
ncbi:MAG: metallophosphoesterase family protein [Bacteroidetes bacterium]|nr:metallophosphoesterase family protein [Bacteroidota bacterium]